MDSVWHTIFLLLAVVAVYILFRKIIFKRLETFAKATTNDLDDRLLQFSKTFFDTLLLFIIVVGLMRIWDVEISPLLAGAGIATAALAFAAKETISDILAGIFLIIDRPMRIGDRVKIKYIGRDWGSWGDVADVGIRRTQIKNTDGVMVDYPNTVLANSVIINFSNDLGPARVRVRFQVAYEADLDKTREITTKAISDTEGVLPDTTSVIIRSLWDDKGGHMLAGVLLEGRYKIEDVKKRSRIRSRVLQEILTRLREEKIPLPSQQFTVTNLPAKLHAPSSDHEPSS